MAELQEFDITAARRDQRAEMLASQAKALVRSRVQGPKQEGAGELSLSPFDELKALALEVINNNER